MMPLADLNADKLAPEALRDALEEAEREGLRQEYKLQVDRNKHGEWALDVTSFANTAGGVVLVGAVETEGLLTALPGIAGDVDAEIQRLEAILRDRVDPTMPGVQFQPIDVDGATVIAVSIPRSWRSPHLVRDGSRWQLARRNSSGKYVLREASEVRATFIENIDAGSRARRWHEEQVVETQAGLTPVALSPGPFLVLTMQPIAATADPAAVVLDVAAAQADDPHRNVQPIYFGGTGPRVNLDGLIVVATRGDSSPVGYAQLHRNASFVYVDTAMLQHEDAVPGTLVVERLLETVERSVRAILWAGGILPVVMQATFVGLEGRPFATSTSQRRFENYVFDRELVRLPELVIDRELNGQADAAAAIRPLLDALWNAVGSASCEHYDQGGGWLGLRPLR